MRTILLIAVLLAPLAALRGAEETRLLWAPDAILPKAVEAPMLQGGAIKRVGSLCKDSRLF